MSSTCGVCSRPIAGDIKYSLPEGTAPETDSTNPKSVYHRACAEQLIRDHKSRSDITSENPQEQLVPSAPAPRPVGLTGHICEYFCKCVQSYDEAFRFTGPHANDGTCKTRALRVAGAAIPLLVIGGLVALSVSLRQDSGSDD